MTYDSPLSAVEGEVIPEVASFKEEGLVTPEGCDWEKGIEPQSPEWNARMNADPPSTQFL